MICAIEYAKTATMKSIIVSSIHARRLSRLLIDTRS